MSKSAHPIIDNSSVLNEGFFELGTNTAITASSTTTSDSFTSVLSYTIDNNEDRIVRRLDRLIEESYDKEVTFVVKDIVFTKATAAATIRVFQYYGYEKKRQWDELILDNMRQNEEFLLVLKEVLKCGLFRKIHIDRPHIEYTGDDDDDDDESDDDSVYSQPVPALIRPRTLHEDTAILLKDAMLSNDGMFQSMQTLILSRVLLDDACASELGKGLVTSSQQKPSSPKNNLLVLQMRDVSFGRGHDDELINNNNNSVLDEFTVGLAQNRSLVGFWMRQVHLGDAQLAKIVSALPASRLQDLNLDETLWHNNTLQAISKLLHAPDCKLEDLSLGSRRFEGFLVQASSSFNTKPSLDHLSQGMSVNRSLESLYLENCHLDDDDFALLMTAASNCPQLAEVDLSENQITSFDTTKKSSSSHFSKLQSLDLSDNPVFLPSLDYWDYERGWIETDHDRLERQHVERLLQAFPGLGQLEDLADSGLNTPHIEYLLDMNRSGIRLLLLGGQQDDDDNHKTTKPPLSLWKLVLARTVKNHKDDARRQANVIYHLLQGPVFAGRESYY
jgi:hypothetical protein